jgi:hypothetical protein
MKKFFSIILITALLTTLLISANAQAATVKLSKAKATMEVDSTLQLKITGSTSKAAWKSSKKSVATVSSSGLITAVAEGTVTITATLSSKKYNCKVTVVDSNKVITPTPAPTAIPTPTPVPEVPLSQRDYLNDKEIKDMYSNTAKYIGKYAELTGQVCSEPVNDGGSVSFLMYQDAANKANLTYIRCYFIQDVKKGDYVYIDAQIYDTYTGEDEDGNEIKTPYIIAKAWDVNP